MGHHHQQNQGDDVKTAQAKSHSAESSQTVTSDISGQPAAYNARQSNVLRLQQTIGNRAVIRRMAAQRVAAPNNNAPAASNDDLPQTDFTYTPQILAAIPIEEVTSGLGDYPTPDPNTVMAKRIAGQPTAVVQRDPPTSGSGTAPDPNRTRLGIDPTLQYTFPIYTPAGATAPVPFSLQVTGLYRNWSLAQIGSDPLGVDFLKEPGGSLAIDQTGAISAQAGITLANFHWMPPWNRQLEVGLSGIVNTTLLPHFTASLGGQLQAEQHIIPSFSVTLSASGMWTPPTGTTPGQFAVTGSLGALYHFNFF